MPIMAPSERPPAAFATFAAPSNSAGASMGVEIVI